MLVMSMSDTFVFYSKLGTVITMNSQVPLTMTDEEIQRFLPPRARDAHKGDFGHTLIVGGDIGMPGAPCLAALGAARSGSGLTTLATRIACANHINCLQPEIMNFGLSKPNELVPLIKRANVIVIGPGLGQSKWSKKVFSLVMKVNLPKVVDADALNLLAKYPMHRHDWILTPHPGEAARLLHSTTEAVQKDRVHAVKAMQKKYGGVCVLKGAGTLVVDDNQIPEMCDVSNPGMASGGMGDLLSGIIGGLLAQHVPLFEAAKCGVFIHAKAAELASKDGERGMLASDLLPFVRKLVNL